MPSVKDVGLIIDPSTDFRKFSINFAIGWDLKHQFLLKMFEQTIFVSFNTALFDFVKDSWLEHFRKYTSCVKKFSYNVCFEKNL